MAELIAEVVPSVEKVRMCNSGTEATMSCIRLARGYTGRSKIIKFAGCYHGHVDSLLVKAGSGALTLGNPDSAGVPESLAKETIVLPYNDEEAVAEALSQNKEEVAAVIIEPFPANCGLILPNPGYLERLRSLCSEHKTLLIFDEVMTGFRLGIGGVQERTGITPDLTAMGKIIGGGLPVGALGGKTAIMDHLAPLGPVYQAGTLSGNPLAMTAGIKTLELLKQPGSYERLEAMTSRLIAGIMDGARSAGLPITGGSVSAMFGFFLCEGPVRNFEEAKAADAERFGKVHRAMLERGIYLAPSAFEAGFTSLAHSDEDIDTTIAAFRECFSAVA